MKNKIKVLRNHKSIKILIGSYLHLKIPTTPEPIIQSWNEHGIWCIEYTVGNSVIVSEYDTVDKWKEILKQLNEVV